MMRRIFVSLSLGLCVGVMCLPAGATVVSPYKSRPLNFYEKILKDNSRLGGYDNVANSGPTVTAAKVINWLLLLLGSVAICLTVYAGFLWMLAAGNEDEIKKAKDILAGSFIGILIVLASFSIMAYAFRSFVNVTN